MGAAETLVTAGQETVTVATAVSLAAIIEAGVLLDKPSE